MRSAFRAALICMSLACAPLPPSPRRPHLHAHSSPPHSRPLTLPLPGAAACAFLARPGVEEALPGRLGEARPGLGKGREPQDQVGGKQARFLAGLSKRGDPPTPSLAVPREGQGTRGELARVETSVRRLPSVSTSFPSSRETTRLWRGKSTRVGEAPSAREEKSQPDARAQRLLPIPWGARGRGGGLSALWGSLQGAWTPVISASISPIPPIPNTLPRCRWPRARGRNDPALGSD